MNVQGPWWETLARLGFDQARWRSFDPLARRAIVTGVWIVIALILIGTFGVVEWTLFAGAAIIFALVVVPYERLPFGRFALPAAVIALAVSYPFYRGSLFGWPIFGTFPAMSTMVVITVFVIMALGLNVVVGYAGLLDLGYVAFYAMGAYSVGWFASDQFAKRDFRFGAVGVSPHVTGIHLSIWLCLLIAAVLTGVVGVLIGLPTLRLRGDYLAIVTLGFGEIMPQIARNGNQLFGTNFNLTGGTQGITPVDAPGFGSWINTHVGLPDNFLAPSADTLHVLSNTLNTFYWTGIILVLVTAFCSIRLRDSRLGRAWIAIREDEVAAAAMGVPLMRTKTWAYATGAFFGGVAGSFFASYKASVFPDDFSFNISVFILCMVILGGMGNIWGVILGATFLAYLDREGLANIGGWLNSNLSSSSFNMLVAVALGIVLVGAILAVTSVVEKVVLSAVLAVVVVYFGILQRVHLPLDVPKYEFGIFGIILVVVMLLRPQGLIASSRRKAEFEVGVSDEPLYDVKS